MSPVGLCDLPPVAGLAAEVGQGSSLQELASASSLARVHHPGYTPFSYNLVRVGGDWDFELPDATVLQLQEAGLEQLVTLRPHAVMGEQPPAQLPSDVDDYALFVERLVERYDGDGVDDMPGLELPVRAWEIDNEPSMALEDPSLYVELVEVSVEAIRRADPQATILVGGAAPILGPDIPIYGAHLERFWAGLFALGVMEHVDVFNFHAPVGDHVDPADLVASWEELGAPQELPWWITEAGSSDPTGGAIHEDDAVRADWLDAWLGSALGQVDRVLICDASALASQPLLLDVIAEHNSR